MFKGAEYITALTSFQAHGAAVTNSLARSPRGPGSNGCPVADRPIVIEFLTQTNQFDQNGLVGEVGIEPTLTALSRQCLRVYKARPKANISNSPLLNLLK